jgi:acyl carrier protein
MGMDAVEIVMAVEEAFYIEIEDAEAEKLLTPRQIIELVMSKVQLTTSDVCLTHRSFNLLRRFFLGQCALTRSQVAPRTPLERLLPRKQRTTVIAQFAATIAIPAPRLVRAGWITATLMAAACLSGLIVALAFLNSKMPAWLPALFTIALTGYAGAMATRNLRTEFPKEISTVADLSRWIMTHKSDLAAPQTNAWTREQVATRVRDIVIETLQCEATYREDASFVKELGLG